MVLTKKKVIFNDTVLKLLLKTNIGTKYSALIISFLTKENLHNLENNLVLSSEEIARNNTLNSTADVIYKYFDTFFDIEINNFYGKAKQVQMDSYKFQLYLKKIKSYKDYKNMNDVYQISLDANDLFHDNHFTYQIVRKDLESNKELKNDFLKDYHINLAYLHNIDYNEIMKIQGLEKYLYFLICDDENFLKELYKGDTFMEELMNESKKIAEDKLIDLYIPEDVIRKMDQELYIEQGYNNGYNSGSNEKQKEIILNLYHKNIPIDTISECTNLSINEVEKIVNDKKNESK